ncbi:AdoMet-dependent rRNA methyltransferase spb1, partial [Coemansia sp. RSA 2599]
EEVKKLRKERKRQNAKRQRQLIKMQLNMVTPTDIGMEQDGGEFLFRTDRIVDNSGNKVLKDISNADMTKIEPDIDLADEELVELGSRPVEPESAAGASGDEDDDDIDSERERRLVEIESQMDDMYSEYMDHKRQRDAQFDIKKKRAAEEEFRGFSDDEASRRNRHGSDDSDTDSEAESASETDREMSDDDGDEIRSMMRNAKDAKKSKKGRSSLAAPDVKLAGRAALWFDQPVFKGIGSVNLDDITDDEEEDSDGVSSSQGAKNAANSAASARMGQSAGKRKRSALDDEGDVEMASDNEESDFDVDSDDEDESDPNDVELKDEERQADYDLATPEAMTM